MIRYLRQDEKRKTQGLWNEAFPEDSESFREYYYQEKAKDNQILVKEEDGQVIAMAHLNPYSIAVKKRRFRSDYIVGVATKGDRRHQGHMRDLLTVMLKDKHQEGMPFLFLMPASPKIYQPFDFTYIFNQPFWEFKDGYHLRREEYKPEHMSAKAAAQWMNSWLSSRYQVYCYRDEAYIRRLLKELSSEGGALYEIYEKEKMIGYQAFWGITSQEQRLLYCEEGYIRERESPKPAIMARIVNLSEFVKPICLRRECQSDEKELFIQIEDGFISENNGIFRWILTKEGSIIEKADCPSKTDIIDRIPIRQMTSWLFGYEPADASWKQDILPLSQIFIDEVV